MNTPSESASPNRSKQDDAPAASSPSAPKNTKRPIDRTSFKDTARPSRGALDENEPPARSPRHGREVRGLKVGVRVLLVIALLGGGVGLFMLMASLRKESAKATDTVVPTLVRAVGASSREVDRVWEGFGTAASMRQAGIASEVIGRVVERPERIEAGRPVDAGELIVAVDPSDYAQQVARAEQAAVALRAQLDGLAVESERLDAQLGLIVDEIRAAEDDLDRTRRAIEQGAGSQGELDGKLAALRRSQREREILRQQAESIPSRRLALQGELGAREAELALAQTNLERTRIVAPFAGELVSVSPRVGDYLSVGMPVATVVDLTRLEIPLRLPARASSWVRIGDEVALWSGEPVGEPTHTGRVARLAPSADASTRTIAVFVEVTQNPDADTRLLPGAFVHGRISTPDNARRVLVPRSAIRSGRVLALRPDEEGLFRVEPIVVEIAYSIDGRIPGIDSPETEWAALIPSDDLGDGARIAITAIERLQPGERVRVEGTPGEDWVQPGTGSSPDEDLESVSEGVSP